MNKSGLVERVADAAGIDKRRAEAAVDALLETIVESTRAGERVSIHNFGAFSRTSRAARLGRNPRTGEAVPIAASTGVKFAPAVAFKSVLNPKGAKKAAAKKSGAKKVTGRKKAVRKTAAKKTAKSRKR